MVEDNWKQLRYSLGAIKGTLETVEATLRDGLTDLEIPDDRFDVVFDDLQADITRWIKAMDNNIHFCKAHEDEAKDRDLLKH